MHAHLKNFKPIFLLMLCLNTSQNLADSFDSRPSFLADHVIKNYYDGKKNDLLTAGWNIKQLSHRKLPYSGDFTDPQWIRRVAYYNNIIALLDTTEAGGYGRLFGPKHNQPAVSGYEYLAYSLDSNNQLDATLMLQIPDNMDLNSPCVIVAASSGSRGIYGAVGTVGSWALTNRCAVAYTDKGTGTGFYFFDSEKGFDIQGRYINANTPSILHSQLPAKANRAFIESYPTAVSVKQAYSAKNIEKDFGKFVIQAGEFSLYQLNQHFKSRSKENVAFTKDNTLIIAASISNGGAASLKAAEQDKNQLFDGIVASEPNIYPDKNDKLIIYQGQQKVTKHSIPGYNYFVATNLFSPCALLTQQAKNKPFFKSNVNQMKQLENWCDNLKTDGFIVGNTTLELANHSLKKLTRLGINPNQQLLSPLSYFIKLWPALVTTYSNQIGRFTLEDNICGVYFSALDNNNPIHLAETNRIGLFANSNGIPPTAGILLTSSKVQPSAYQQAKCFYQLSKLQRVQKGVSELIANANLNNIPTIILHGRSDNLIAPNHSSRPYYANAVLKANESIKSNVKVIPNIRYYEITNAQHFDAFASLPQFSSHFVPLHYYFEQTMQYMLDHLRNQSELPASQVVKTKTRGLLLNQVLNQVIGLKNDNLPKIEQNPQYPIVLQTRQKGGVSLIIPN